MPKVIFLLMEVFMSEKMKLVLAFVAGVLLVVFVPSVGTTIKSIV